MATSLTYKDRHFLLNGSPFHILSGAIHYFRVVPEYWRDRLLKAKACGLNTVETYVPWNLHEEQQGVFKSDGILDLRGYIQLAYDLGLKVILRPGPYICSEWDFGGLPSWLLADPNMKVRSGYHGYTDAAQKYLQWVIGLVKDLQNSKGGPIIAVQVENEFASFSEDVGHLEFIKDTLIKAGVTELLVTSDCSGDTTPAMFVPGVLPTGNFQKTEDASKVFDLIMKADSDFPLMSMEFWTGWFDHWGSEHQARDSDNIAKTLKFILDKNGSVNFYMFHGGTNFGFMAGANLTNAYKPDVTSYDYDAPLSEEGRPTEKFFKIREIIKEFLSRKGNPITPCLEQLLPESPAVLEKRREILMSQVLKWPDIISLVKKVTSCPVPKTMEMLSFQNGGTQSFGYIVYRKAIKDFKDSSELILPPHVKDRATVLLDGKIVATFDWKNSGKFSTVLVGPTTSGSCVLDIVVENMGRVNYTEKDTQDVLNTQRKGIEGEITLAGNTLKDWTVIALDFSEVFLSDVCKNDAWQDYISEENETDKAGSPALYRGEFEITEKAADCFVKLDGFEKGIAVINGFNLGRYWSVGPQRTLYLPGPLLKEGENEILVFEEMKAAGVVSLEVKAELS